jgi:DNA-binding transcriptional LysR family regulator
MSSIRTLKTFLAVARHGSFVGAAQDVGLTAAAIGLQMTALERSLGQTLFERGKRSVVLNPAARRLIAPTEELVARWESLLIEDETDGTLSGVVVMGALVSSLMGAFADALWAVRQANPRLDVKLFAGMSSDFSMRVARGELDAAIVTQPPDGLAPGLVWAPLYAEPMVLIVPRSPRFAMTGGPLAMLANSPFIRFDRSTWTGRLVDQVLTRCEAKAQSGMELNSVEAIVEIVRQGFGVSIVPKLANVAWSHDRSLRVLRLPNVDVQRRVGLLERSGHSRERFTGAIKHYFANRPVRRATRLRSGRSAAR